MRHRHAVVLLAVLAFIAAACGARLSDEELTAAQAGGGTATGSPTDSGTDSGADAASGGTDTTLAGTATDTGTDAGTDTGTATDAGGSGGAGATACKASGGATDVGVTDTEITIGNVSTISGPVPGFGQTGQNGAKAYVAYINSKGGVCGRKLKLVSADDRLDTGTNRSETERLSKSVFGFVGGTSVVDDGGAAVINGIPDSSLAIGEQRIASPSNFSPNPIDLASGGNGTVPLMTYLKQKYGVVKGAVVYPAQSTARNRGKAYVKDMGDAGIAPITEIEVAITETNYAGVANKIKNEGADLVITTLEVNGMARLAQAFNQVGYKPKVPFYGAQAYGNQFLTQAGPGAEGTILGLTYSIFEDRAQNPAMDQFLTWYQRVAPGSKPDFFSVMSWGAADLFVQALEKVGAQPKRAAVIEAMKTFTAFDAHGFLAPRNPAGKKIGPCFMIATIEGGKWKRVFPDKGFQC